MDSGEMELKRTGSGEETEVEWQFEPEDLSVARSWIAASPLRGTVQLAPAPVRDLHDVYYDTADWRVFNAGYALRIREKGGRAEATLKALSPPREGLARRREISQALSGPDLEAFLDSVGEVIAAVRLICGASILTAVGEVRTRREVRVLRSSAGAAGELALDETVLLGPGGGPEADVAGAPAGGGSSPESAAARAGSGRGRTRGRRILEKLHRIEVEVPEDAVEAFRPFAESMRAELALPPARLSKFERALGSRGLDPRKAPDFGPAAVLPSMTTGEAAYAVLRTHFVSFLRNQPGTRLGEDPERLHDMRVASRRLRAALRLFHDALPARLTGRSRQRLGEVASALGAVRDLDVLMEQIEVWGAELITTGRSSLEPLQDLLRRKRRKARERLLRVLDAPRHARFLEFFSAELRRGSTRRPPLASLPVRLTAPVLVKRARKKARSAARAVERERRRIQGGRRSPTGGPTRKRSRTSGAAAAKKTAAPSTSASSIPAPSTPAAEEGLWNAQHKLRIRCKRFRYTLEFLEPVSGASAREMIRAMIEIQDILGLQQDSRVAIAELRSLAATQARKLPRETLLALAETVQLHDRRRSRLSERLPDAVRKLDGKLWKSLRRFLKNEAPTSPSQVLRIYSRAPAGSRKRTSTPGGREREVAHGSRRRPPDRPAASASRKPRRTDQGNAEPEGRPPRPAAGKKAGRAGGTRGAVHRPSRDRLRARF